MDNWWEVAVSYTQPSLVLCDDLEEWDGRGEGGPRERGPMYNYGWCMLLYVKNQYNIVKI